MERFEKRVLGRKREEVAARWGEKLCNGKLHGSFCVLERYELRSQEIPHILRNAQVHCCLHSSWTWDRLIHSTLSHLINWSSTLMLFPVSEPGPSKWTPPYQKPVCTSVRPPPTRASYPIRIPPCYLVILIIFAKEYQSWIFSVSPSAVSMS